MSDDIGLATAESTGTGSAPVAVRLRSGDGNGRSAAVVSRRDLATGVAFSGLAVAILLPAWHDILRLGIRDEELSYVLLAPVMIGWLAYVRRGLLSKCRARGGWVGLLILALGWAVYSYGYFADPVLWRAGAVVIAIGAFAAAAGSDVLLRFAPVFAACIFLVPVSPDGRFHVAVPLQTATARATQTLCDLLGLYVDRSGNMLSINGVDVTVAEACNGMRMVFTLFMVCYVVAFTARLRPTLRVLLLACSPLVAIAANVLRLVPTVWMFGNASVSRAQKFHDVSGWVMTVVAFVILLTTFTLIQRRLDGASQRRSGQGVSK